MCSCSHRVIRRSLPVVQVGLIELLKIARDALLDLRYAPLHLGAREVLVAVVAARKPARFGLNEVPIGIPMPAAYVEIIKYALGEQIAALATLRGKLYELEEASRLGFCHEVVEPNKLLATAISYARCIAPDCNTAYAMSKKALQDGVLR